MAQLRLDSPEDLLRFQLRTALTMEHDSLAMLGELGAAARSKEVKAMFSHHASETKEQVENLKRVFALLGFDESTAGSPSTKGLAKQGTSLLARASKELTDIAALSSALATEHHEIAAYQALLVSLGPMGLPDAEQLLRSNLEQEQHTSEELHAKLTAVAA